MVDMGPDSQTAVQHALAALVGLCFLAHMVREGRWVWAAATVVLVATSGAYLVGAVSGTLPAFAAEVASAMYFLAIVAGSVWLVARSVVRFVRRWRR